MLKSNPIIKLINDSLIKLPTPSNISFLWNFGSLLGFMLMIQLITGIILSMFYTAHIDLAFFSVNYISQTIYNGWLIRMIHMNGASFFFICMYLHIGRNLYYESFMLKETWMIGVTIFLLSMMTAFLGYVLPWGQMSYWGAMVITNLITTIPYIGDTITQWIWSGFTINNLTLSRFYSLHFILPFIISALVLIHLIYLHQTGSNNPLMINMNIDKIPFSPFFLVKDLLTMILLFFILILISLKTPYMLSDPDNFITANPLSTPPHIQPEWYFLFAYAILRSIPNKLGGVIALLMSILILYFLPFMFNKKIQGNQFYLLNKIWFWLLITDFIMLTWLGAQVIEQPFTTISQITSIYYFLNYLMIPLINNLWNLLIK